MAAVTPSVKQFKTSRGNGYIYYGTSAANQADTMTITANGSDHSYKVSYASAVYSNTPTQAGVTFTIDSGLGAGYDSQVTAGSANARHSVMTTDVPLLYGDAFVISVPAGGSGLTVGMTVVLEPI